MAAAAAGGPPGKGHEISLAALRRHDPYISRIVDVASQVALYTFFHRANKWVRAGARTTGRGLQGMDGRAGSDPGAGRSARPSAQVGKMDRGVGGAAESPAPGLEAGRQQRRAERSPKSSLAEVEKPESEM